MILQHIQNQMLILQYYWSRIYQLLDAKQYVDTPLTNKQSLTTTSTGLCLRSLTASVSSTANQFISRLFSNHPQIVFKNKVIILKWLATTTLMLWLLVRISLNYRINNMLIKSSELVMGFRFELLIQLAPLNGLSMHQLMRQGTLQHQILIWIPKIDPALAFTLTSIGVTPALA